MSAEIEIPDPGKSVLGFGVLVTLAAAATVVVVRKVGKHLPVPMPGFVGEWFAGDPGDQDDDQDDGDDQDDDDHDGWMR